MDYKEFLNERKAGMMTTIESMESPCLEAFKKRNKEEGEAAAKSFFNFLKKKDPEAAEECEKNPGKFKQFIVKRVAAYKEWAEKHPKAAAVLQVTAATQN